MQEEMFASVKVAIVLEGYPEAKMTEEQAEIVETRLVEKLNQTDQEEPIQFAATEYVDGALVFTCDNKRTKVWLFKNARRLVPWRGATLAVGYEETTLNGVGMVMWVVTHMSKRSNEQILDLLQKQNKEISTAKWRIFNKDTERETDEKVRLKLWIDKKSYDELKAHNFKLFLGLDRAKFMLTSEWNKLKSNSTKQLTPENPTRRSTNYVSVRPQYPQRLTGNYTPYKPEKPMSPWLVPPPIMSHSILTPSSGYWAEYQSWGLGVSDPNPHRHGARIGDQYRLQSRELKFADTDTPHFHKAQFMSPDPLLPQEHTESSVLRNCKSRYFASDHWQLRETEYGGPEASQLRDRFTVSDRAQSRDSRYVPPDRDQFENSRFGGSNRPPSLVSRFGKLDEPLTETDILQNVASTFLTSEQTREHRLRTSELVQPRAANYSLSDIARRGEHGYTSVRPQENKYSASESRQSLETGYRAPVPPPLLGTSYTAADRALSRNSTSVTTSRDKSRDSRYVPPNPDMSENRMFRGSGEPLSSISRFSDLNEPLTETAILPSLSSAFLSTEQPHVREFNVSELPQSQEASYSVSDRTQLREPRYTSDGSQENKYFTSDARQPLETVKAPYPPPLLGIRINYTALNQSHDFESVTGNRDKSRDSRYVPRNGHHSDNTRFSGSDQLPSRVSRYGDKDATLTETAKRQNLTSTFLSSEQPREHGYKVSELSQSQEASYSVSDRSQPRESRYTLDRHRDDKYSTSDCRHPLETVHRAPDLARLRGTSYVASDQTPSRISRSAIRNRDKYCTSTSLTANRDKSRDSRISGLSDLDEPATLENLSSALITLEQPRYCEFSMSELSQSQEAGYSVLDRALRREYRYTSDRHQDDKYLPSDSRQPLEAALGFLDRPQLRETHYSSSDRALPRDSKSVTANRDRERDSRYVPPNQEQSEYLMLRDSNRVLSRDSKYRNRDESPVRESRFRDSDKMHSREGRFEEREYPHESRSRFDNTVSRVRSREDRISGSDISRERSRSPYRSSRHSHFSSKTKW